MRTVGKVLLLSVAIFVACATQSADPGPRLSAIEDRLMRLEERLNLDAGVVGPRSDDAGVDAMEESYFNRLFPFDGGFVFDPARFVADCKAGAEERCSEELIRARVEAERAGRRGFGWIEAGPAPAANSTPAGRACLERERQRCERLGQRDKVFEWLDAQLVPGKRDEKVTSEVRERVANQRGVSSDKIDIVCAAQFCRLGPGFTNLFLGPDFDQRITEGNRYGYVMRRGFELVR